MTRQSLQILKFVLVGMLTATALYSTSAMADEYLTGIEWKKPPVITPPAEAYGPPSDAIVLFDGKDLSAWKNAENWSVQDGVMVAGKGFLISKEEFGDCQLHIEWTAPTPPKGTGQGRGNSGIFLMNTYEIQVLDSFENETYFDGQAGAIYKQTPPMVNVMRKPGEWNTYDILWTAPKFNEDGSLKSPAYMTALHNGVVILNHFELLGDTPFNRPPRYDQGKSTGPIGIQDHGNPVLFRNIWVRPIVPITGERVSEPYLRDNKGNKKQPVAPE